MQDEWVRLGRGKGENAPSGGERRGQEDGLRTALRTEEAIEDVCLEGRGGQTEDREDF